MHARVYCLWRKVLDRLRWSIFHGDRFKPLHCTLHLVLQLKFVLHTCAASPRVADLQSSLVIQAIIVMFYTISHMKSVRLYLQVGGWNRLKNFLEPGISRRRRICMGERRVRSWRNARYSFYFPRKLPGCIRGVLDESTYMYIWSQTRTQLAGEKGEEVVVTRSIFAYICFVRCTYKYIARLFAYSERHERLGFRFGSQLSRKLWIFCNDMLWNGAHAEISVMICSLASYIQQLYFSHHV